MNLGFIFAFDLLRRSWIQWRCRFHTSVVTHFQWRFQGLQGLSFRWRFMDKYWHSVIDNSLRQPWLYFCYRFDASVVNSLTLSIPHVSCHSIFIGDFKVYSDCFRWRFMDQLSHNVFDNSLRQPWVYFCYWFDVSVVNSLTLSVTTRLFKPKTTIIVFYILDTHGAGNRRTWSLTSSKYNPYNQHFI